MILLNKGRNSGGVNVTVFIRSRSDQNTTKYIKIEADGSEVYKFYFHPHVISSWFMNNTIKIIAISSLRHALLVISPSVYKNYKKLDTKGNLLF